MTYYRRRLPHLYTTGQPVFVTWHLQGSLPPNRTFQAEALSSGQAFAALDRLLDEARSGPMYLRQPAIAHMVVQAIQFNAQELGHYVWHAFVVMPDHVHLLLTPSVELPGLMKSLKGITAKRSNSMLGLTGNSFRQEESYDRLVRDAGEYRWSSAGMATRGLPADQGVRPTPSE
jgi:putative transposase